MMFIEKMKEKEKYVGKMKAFLMEMDTDGNGKMNEGELDMFLQSENALQWLHKLGLEADELCVLFNILDDGDGEVMHDEFIASCMRLTGQARAIDSVLLMHEQTKILCRIDTLQSQM